MRREIGLYDRIHEWGNLQEALLRASRGKRDRPEVAAFLRNHPAGIEEVADRLRRGDGPLGRFREFSIRDPKPRLISAPCFADRVLQPCHDQRVRACL